MEMWQSDLQKLDGEMCCGHFDDFGHWHHDWKEIDCMKAEMFDDGYIGICQVHEFEQAACRLGNLDRRHYFLLCFKDPTKSSSRRPLAGLVQESCIYDYR